jgi:hypothetical protein
MDLKEIVRGSGRYSFGSGWRGEHSIEPSGSINEREFLGQLRDYSFLLRTPLPL